MAIPKNTKQKLTPEEIQKAYQEFETGMTEIRANLRTLVEQTIKKVDIAKAEEILKSL